MLTTIGLILAAMALAALIAAMVTWGLGRDCDISTWFFFVRPAVEGLCQVLGIVLLALVKSGE